MDKKDLFKFIRLFREKTNANKLVVFVGSGVSCNVAGMPSWNDLIRKMAESIKYSRCDSCGKKDADCQDTCKFINEFSSDELLKIPQYVYNRSKTLYNRVLRENIKHSLEIDAPLSKAILDLAPAHIITTNYDKLIEICKSIQKDNYGVIISDSDLLNATKNKYIIKMHGDIESPDTIVLKEVDYLDYSQKHVLIEIFIKSLFTDHTVLFLGYSLNDYNVKLIISWINFIRDQNKKFDKATKFAYIVLDEKKIDKTQLKYFECNNIGVINLNQMPLIEEIPAELSNDIGKRLFSFLRTIENPYFENAFGACILLKEVVSFAKNYKYVDCKNLCLLLSLKNCLFSGYELSICVDPEYDRLIEMLSIGGDDATYLQQLFYDAGIYYVRSPFAKREEEYYAISATHMSLLDDRLYATYLKNDYVGLLNTLNNDIQISPFEFCFYLSIVKGYTDSIFERHSSIKYDELTTNDKVRYLYNEFVLEFERTFKNSRQPIINYINGLTDVREKRMYSLYSDLFEGSHKILQKLGASFDKLRDIYYKSDKIHFSRSSLLELYILMPF